VPNSFEDCNVKKKFRPSKFQCVSRRVWDAYCRRAAFRSVIALGDKSLSEAFVDPWQIEDGVANNEATKDLA